MAGNKHPTKKQTFHKHLMSYTMLYIYKFME